MKKLAYLDISALLPPACCNISLYAYFMSKRKSGLSCMTAESCARAEAATDVQQWT